MEKIDILFKHYGVLGYYVLTQHNGDEEVERNLKQMEEVKKEIIKCVKLL